MMKGTMLILLLVVLTGCAQKPLNEQEAIDVANNVVSRFTELGMGELILQNTTLQNDTWQISYNFEDGSGPVIIEVDRISGNATHITLDRKRDKIEDFFRWFDEGVKLLS